LWCEVAIHGEYANNRGCYANNRVIFPAISFSHALLAMHEGRLGNLLGFVKYIIP
jgi:hypothetical protein